MKPSLNEKFIAYLALLSGLSVSVVAIYYSVVGLTAIFAAAVIPIIVMGVVLEIGKLVATVWLKQNWTTAPFLIKIYLMAAVAVLMLITSMGIFGFLSKSHSDQSLVSGDVMARIAVYDEKIKTAKDNIDVNRRALKQMDDAVEQVMGRSTTEKGADKAVTIRRAQAKERARLLSEITENQSVVSKLNESRAPIAADVRRVEAEVGPIKYIAAFVYGNTDQTVLEKSVTWVIISLIVVFDPLAVMLLLASQVSFQQFKEREAIMEGDSPKVEDPNVVGEITVTHPPSQEVISESVVESPLPDYVEHLTVQETLNFDKTPYVFDFNTSSHTMSTVEKSNITLAHESIELLFADDVVHDDEPLYIQNEEQNESNMWTTASNVISQQTYLSTSRLRMEQQLTDQIQKIKAGTLQISDLPLEIQEIIKLRM